MSNMAGSMTRSMAVSIAGSMMASMMASMMGSMTRTMYDDSADALLKKELMPFGITTSRCITLWVNSKVKKKVPKKRKKNELRIALQEILDAQKHHSTFSKIYTYKCHLKYLIA